MKILVAFIILIFSIKSFASTTNPGHLDSLIIKEEKAIKLINLANEMKPNYTYQQNFVVSLQQIREEIAQNKEVIDQKKIENCDQKLNILIKSIQNYLNS